MSDKFLNAKIKLLMELRRHTNANAHVLSAIETVPREIFVPSMFESQAYDDIALPIEAGQTISQPTVVATMTSALEVGDRMRVLEIGTGSGYQTAILSKLARRVYTIERHKELLQVAEDKFAQLGLSNVTAIAGDGTKGWPEAAPFDRIIVTAAAAKVPAELLDQLAVGGIMVIPVGDPSGNQILLRIIRDEDGYSSQHMMDVRFVPLVEGKVES